MRSISEKKRVVIKLGTSTLAHKTGKLNIRRMTNLVRVISDLHNSGKESSDCPKSPRILR